MVFPGVTVVKNPPANAGDARDIDLLPDSGRSPGEGNGSLLQTCHLKCSHAYRKQTWLLEGKEGEGTHWENWDWHTHTTMEASRTAQRTLLSTL